MTGLRADIAGAWAQARSRVVRPPETVDELGTICLSVSELGWQATLQLPNEPVQTMADSWMDADVRVTTVEAIRRAVRSISRAQRERIGSMRLAVADSAIVVIDNRSARIRSADAGVIAQVGAQELGADAVLYGFVPFGQSSEFEMARDAYAFVAVDQVKEYLAALDTLAPCLVELVPIPLLELANAQTDALAIFELRSNAATLLLADPETGAVLGREIAGGRSDFVAAIAEATSVSAREAAEGLQRRVCFQPEAGWSGATMPVTATERALTKLLSNLKIELSEWFEHFVHHRLANAPSRLLIQGEADRIRGLPEWVAHAIGIPAGPGIDLHQHFADTPGSASRNLLENSPTGLLTIGKTEYRFAEGRFRSDPSQAPRPGRARGVTLPSLPRRKTVLAWARERRVAVPAGVALALGAAIWLVVDNYDPPLDRAAAALSAAEAEDGALRHALLQQQRALAMPVSAPTLPWFDKLSMIAGALPKDVRIIRIAAGGADPALDDKLVLEGEAIAAEDTLANIGAMIDRLSNVPAFMRDVGAISFGGAEEADRGGGLLHFTVNVSLVKRPASSERAGRS